MKQHMFVLAVCMWYFLLTGKADNVAASALFFLGFFFVKLFTFLFLS